jgi:hypothetical protein
VVANSQLKAPKRTRERRKANIVRRLLVEVRLSTSGERRQARVNARRRRLLKNLAL